MNLTPKMKTYPKTKTSPKRKMIPIMKATLKSEDIFKNKDEDDRYPSKVYHI